MNAQSSGYGLAQSERTGLDLAVMDVCVWVRESASNLNDFENLRIHYFGTAAAAVVDFFSFVFLF